jgi:hypothetical protein
MSRTTLYGRGVALALTIFGLAYAGAASAADRECTTAFNQATGKMECVFGASIQSPTSTPAAAPAAQPVPANPDSIAARYNGPDMLHVPGQMDDNKMRPKFVYMRTPTEIQHAVAIYGAQGIQDMVVGSLGECSDIFNLNAELNDYDTSVDAYKGENKKLVKDLPRHEAWQMFLTGLDGASQVVTGVATAAAPGAQTAGISYAAGGVVRTIKQLGNDRWSARLDAHFLHGSAVTVKGMKVFLSSQRIYQREMTKYCPLLESYTARYGSQIYVTSAAAVAQGQAP